jgi:predicted kinase
MQQMSEVQSLNLMCGFSASGKSTYVRKNFFNCVVISEELHRALSVSSFREDWKKFYREAEESIVKRALSNGLSVAIDKTCMSRARRQRWIRLVQLENEFRKPLSQVSFQNQELIRIECYYFKSVSYEEAIERNAARDKPYAMIEEVREAIEWQKREFQEPTINEGFDGIHLL